MTGQSADFILELVARNMDDYSEILLRRIGKIDNVVALHSSFVIKEYNVFNCYNLLNSIKTHHLVRFLILGIKLR